MNKKHKIELCLRGALRTAFSAGGVAAFRNSDPTLTIAFMLGGYVLVVYGMEYTAKKFKEQEEKEVNPKAYLRENTPDEELIKKIDIIDRVETKIVNKIFKAADKTVDFVKKCKLAINNHKNSLKNQQKKQIDYDNELLSK